MKTKDAIRIIDFIEEHADCCHNQLEWYEFCDDLCDIVAAEASRKPSLANVLVERYPYIFGIRGEE